VEVPKTSLWQEFIDWKRMPSEHRTPLIEWLRRILFRKNCGKCRYFEYERDNIHGIGSMGNCIRFPPSIHDHDDELDSFPRVFSEFTVCGKFKRGRRISQ